MNLKWILYDPFDYINDVKFEYLLLITFFQMDDSPIID